MIASGTRFGNLVVVEEVSADAAGKGGRHNTGGRRCWCRCDCGARVVKRSLHLRQGTKTCGQSGCQFMRSLRLAAARLGAEAMRRKWSAA